MTDTATSDEITQAAVEALRKIGEGSKPDLVEPEEGEDGDTGPRFVTNGGVRFEITGRDGTSQRFFLRRPFLGELQDIDLAHESMIDELNAVSNKTTQQAERLKAQATQAEANEALTDTQRSKKIRDLRGKDRKLAQEMRHQRTDLLVKWWAHVFELLCVDGSPEEWPAWISDLTLPGKVMEHFRTVPLGRGA